MEEDRLGMSISGDVAEIMKDANGVIGISVGGGAPYCPCIYVVQVFENSPTALNGRIQAGDEIVSVNGIPVKGENKTAIAKMIQETEGSVKLGFNILHAEIIDGHTLDIALKKMKHRVVESITTETADALGLSRAILSNDLLLQKLNRLERCSQFYKKLIKHLNALLTSHYHIARTQKEFGDLFCEIAARESSPTTNKALSTFGNTHRALEKHTVKLVKCLHPIVRDLNTFVEKAIPDTKLTLKKYLDAKFEYLSFCLKLKEMDDEEAEAACFDEPLYRVETGNYEYRLMLRCRQNSHEKFMKLRKDVMEKLELLDQKHGKIGLFAFAVQDIGIQLSNFVKAIMVTHAECRDAISGANGLFPIDIDLEQIVHRYNTSGRVDEEEEEENNTMEIVEESKPEDLLDLS
uniref:PRKCA-binding protein n=1 Tax=Elaeophora elaphi TaxID=1147741 RepID=A0A0R3RS32_9BILA